MGGPGQLDDDAGEGGWGVQLKNDDAILEQISNPIVIRKNFMTTLEFK